MKNTVTINGRVSPLDSLTELKRLICNGARITAVHYEETKPPSSRIPTRVETNRGEFMDMPSTDD